MKIFRNQDLKLWNSFRTGGEADIIYLPESQDELIALADSLYYDFYIIGSGTNLLVSDRGIKKPIICTKGLISYKVKGREIITEAGVLSKEVSKIACSLSMVGFEFLDGIPGTIGGAVYGNSGSGGESISELFRRATVLSCKNNILNVKHRNEMGFSRRFSDLHGRKAILISVVLSGKESSTRTDIRKKKDLIHVLKEIKRLGKIRTKTQPLGFPSAGTVFRHPDYVKESYSKIRVKSKGDAVVSELNSGFILNKEKATSREIYSLIQSVRKETIEITGKDPELEIQLLGEM